MLLEPSGGRPGTLLSAPQRTGQPPTAESHLTQMSVVPRLRNPDPAQEAGPSLDLIYPAANPCGSMAKKEIRKRHQVFSQKLFFH